MKKLQYICLFFGGAVIGLAVLSIYARLNKNTNPFSLQSPLPDALANIFPKVLGTSEHWYPTKSPDSHDNIPHLTAVAGLSYDLNSEKMLFSKNEGGRFPIASLTKIMTAIVALENDEIGKTYTVSQKAILVGENAMGLNKGEEMTLEELLYGMMLPSGNDAAEVIAENSRFGRDGFVYRMNKKAEELGMSNTHFTNPSGLEGDGNQYATAIDLLILSRYAMKNSDFAKIVGTYEHEIKESENHGYFFLRNDTNLLTSYPGVRGVKTGFTWEAGMCLVTYYEDEGIKIIAVLLNSQDRRGEMKTLLDYSIRSVGRTPPKHI